MENNNVYNLMTQLTQESKSLWRIKKNYIKEAKTKASKDFWNGMLKEKTKHVKDLKALLKAELK